MERADDDVRATQSAVGAGFSRGPAGHGTLASTVYTDALKSYDRMGERGCEQKVIDHAEKYVEGQIHTNGLENFWSLLKRVLKGTYVSVEPFHLFRYLDEQTYRFYHYRWLRRVSSAVSALYLVVLAARSWIGERAIAPWLTLFAAFVAVAAGFTWWQTRSGSG